MDQLRAGVLQFQQEGYQRHRELFARLATGQQPRVLFLTCADSRIDPNLITSSVPGELFICRNPGNLVPPYGVEDGGVATTAEYAIDVLGVRQIVVCGHSDCGAMRALLEPEKVATLPSVAAWLRHGEAARRISGTAHAQASGTEQLRLLTEDNILAQLANLRTYPAVAAHLAAHDLTLHGWYYDIPSGQVWEFDPEREHFVPLAELVGAAPAPQPHSVHSHS